MTRPPIHRCKKGTTLVELAIVLVLFSILSVMITSFSAVTETYAADAQSRYAFLDECATLRHEISYQVRLVNTDDYLIDNGAALGGLVAGILAGNNDVTDLFIDGTRKIFGYDKADMALFLADLESFIATLEKVIRDANVNVTITVSVAPEDLTDSLKKYL